MLAAALLAGTFALGVSVRTPAVGVADHGTYVVSVGGHRVGTEKFEITSTPEKIEAKAEIDLHVAQQGKRVDFRIFPHLVLNPELNPLTYTWDQKGAQPAQLEVDFRSSPAKIRYRTVTGEDDQRDFALPKDVVVLDDNVVHHYQLAVNRYHLTPGGKQTFQAFIPQEAAPGVLTFEDAGTESIGGATLHHLVVSTELARIELWVDQQQRLQRILIPEIQFEAVRK
jgi:hypothetical protein